MNRREFHHNRAVLFGGRGEDDTGMEFWSFAMLRWERDEVVSILKRCAKEAFIEATGKDEHWPNHRFMAALGRKVKTILRDRDMASVKRGQKRRKFKA